MVRNTVMSNGIKVVSLKMSGVSSVSIGIWIKVGARYETQKKNGLSHFLEHMLFRSISDDSFRIAKQIDIIGGRVNAFTSMEYTCYYAQVASSVHLTKIVKILAKNFLKYKFSKKKIEKERVIISQEINSYENNPKEVIIKFLRSALWNNNSLGQSILGSYDNIMRFDESDLINFFKLFYVPNRIIIAAAGDVDHQYMIDKLEPTFGNLENNLYNIPTNNYSSPIGSDIFIEDDILNQAYVCLGMIAPSAIAKNRFAYSIIHTIIGGSSSSKLSQSLRNETGLVYSSYSSMLSYTDTGLFLIHTTVDPKNILQCIDVISNMIKKILCHKLTLNEIEIAKKHIEANLLMSSECTYNQMTRLAYNEFYFGYNIPILSDIKSCNTVTRDTIMSTVFSIFRKENISLAIMSPISMSQYNNIDFIHI